MRMLWIKIVGAATMWAYGIPWLTILRIKQKFFLVIWFTIVYTGRSMTWTGHHAAGNFQYFFFNFLRKNELSSPIIFIYRGKAPCDPNTNLQCGKNWEYFAQQNAYKYISDCNLQQLRYSDGAVTPGSCGPHAPSADAAAPPRKEHIGSLLSANALLSLRQFFNSSLPPQVIVY